MTPYRTAILTDSTCDLPLDQREQYAIRVVPLQIVWGSESYVDGVEMTAEQFYDRLPVDPVHPTTSMPSPGQFLQAYQAAREQGAESILVLTISSAMSGTIESARKAAEMVDFPVKIHDSKTNSMGLGWQVLAAARAREAGADLDGMAEAADRVRRRMVYIISLDTLDYLQKGGRIAGATRFIGSLLKIKPQITVNHETGKVEAGMPARSRERAVEGLYRDFFSKVDGGKPLHITVLHNAALPEAQALAERIRAAHPSVELFIQIVSPVLGVHTGPRAIALCGYAEE